MSRDWFVGHVSAPGTFEFVGQVTVWCCHMTALGPPSSGSRDRLSSHMTGHMTGLRVMGWVGESRDGFVGHMTAQDFRVLGSYDRLVSHVTSLWVT